MSTVVVVTTHPLSAYDAHGLVDVAGSDASKAQLLRRPFPRNRTSASMSAVVNGSVLGVAAAPRDRHTLAGRP